MSISYEEALDTLTAMFGDPWTQESLDAVLRHYKGHMENTVEAVLAHGDGDPQVLLKKLKSESGASDATAMDEAIARQLAQEERRGRRTGGSQRAPRSNTTSQRSPAVPAPAPAPKGRGTPTELPPDFLRIPGAPIPATTVTTTGNSTMDQDEALARMLQDELFSQELRNNPEFAHLARGGGRGRPRTVGGRPVGMRSNVGEMPRRSSAGNNNEGPNLLDKISELGDNAKNRLAAFAAQWNENNRRTNASSTSARSSGAPQQETRGLLDNDDDGEEMEMTFAGTGGSKKNM